MEIPHSIRKFQTALAQCSARFQILTGIATLGAASAILMVSRGPGHAQNRKMSLQMIPMLFGAIGLLFFTTRPKHRSIVE
ncbi:MAG TPA: hypothetical protein VFV92_06310 [Candidatus Bathyarchaeia archaeon]|nr:hypothetical protein [Candidatus Bathyarchaeia archaeon]